MKEINDEKFECLSNIRCDSPVKNFYNGRSVFVTGSTGFLGTVLVEKLLHSCDGIKRIYVLLKQKNGQSIEDRMSAFKESRAFQRLREHNPNFFRKIKPIGGNMLEPNIGLSEKDNSILCNEVSVVFHLAANISFDMRMADAINTNTKSTAELIRICKGMSKLTAFVYVSSAYSNCNELVIDEKVYKTKVPADRVYELIQHSKNEDILNLLLDGRPNTYSYSKALTEELIQMHSNELPAVIIRPSIIMSSLRDPEPGWLNSWNGLDQIIYGAITGKAKCWHVDPSLVQDTVPVDYTANLTIVSAWDQHVRRTQGDKLLKVFNCCSSHTNPISAGKIMSLCMDYYTKDSDGKRNVKPWFLMIKIPLLYYFVAFFLHFIPAMTVDLFNWFFGRKTQMMQKCKKIFYHTQVFKYYSFNQFLFVNNNVRNLLTSMDETDKIIFDFDVRNIKWEEFLQNYVIGLKKLVLENK